MGVGLRCVSRFSRPRSCLSCFTGLSPVSDFGSGFDEKEGGSREFIAAEASVGGTEALLFGLKRGFFTYTAIKHSHGSIVKGKHTPPNVTCLSFLVPNLDPLSSLLSGRDKMEGCPATYLRTEKEMPVEGAGV